MKKKTCSVIAAFITFLIFANTSTAQNVGINTTGATADPSAILDLNTGNIGNVGFLAPQASLASTTDVTTIASPAIGLIVYNTNAGMGNGVGYYYYNGTTWLYLYNTGSPLASSGWQLTGNSGTTASSSAIGTTANNNFIGTTDAVDLVIAAHGFERMRIAQSTGNIGIGTISPICALDIHGTGYLHVSGTSTPSLSAQGAYLNWNITGSQGETDLINNQGGGPGGFTFYNTPNSGSPVTAIDRISGSGSLGIGSNLPNRALEIEGSTNTERIAGLQTGNAFNSSSTNNASNLVYVNSASGDIYSLPTVNNATLVTGTTGVPSWQTGGNNGIVWSLNGNANTITGTNFIGTTDAHNLMFKVNGNQSGLIDFSNGRTFFGYRSGIATATGSNNTGFGYQALASISAGNDNTAVGYDALTTVSAGSNNTAVGFFTLANNTNGGSNTAYGYNALNANTTGSNNVSIGDNTLTASSTTANTAVGSGALRSSTANSNTAVGYNALTANSTGAPNTAVGYQALESNTTGTNNIAVGDNALNANTTTSLNTAVGSGALRSNTATGNTALGYLAAFSNTTGTGNTALGYQALYNGTPDSINNTAVGYQAMYNCTTRGTTAVGYQALYSNTGAENSAVGYQAMNANTTGVHQVAFGYLSLADNTIGNFNTALGRRALQANTAGIGNTAVGDLAMNQSTTGQYNVSVGLSSLYFNGAGNNNVAVGYIALNNNGGNDNVGIGYSALVLNGGGGDNVAIGSNALSNNSNEFNNTAVGYDAMQSSGGNNNCTALGSNTVVLSGTNGTAIGSMARVTANNTIQLGNAFVTGLYFGTGGLSTGTGTALEYLATGQIVKASSSKRYKKDITDMKVSSSLIYKLRPVSYTYKADSTHTPTIGLIAEEVAQVVPELVVFAPSKKCYSRKYI